MSNTQRELRFWPERSSAAASGDWPGGRCCTDGAWRSMNRALTQHPELVTRLPQIGQQLLQALRRHRISLANVPVTNTPTEVAEPPGDPEPRSELICESYFSLSPGPWVSQAWRAAWFTRANPATAADIELTVRCQSLTLGDLQQRLGEWLPGWIHEGLQPLSAVSQSAAAATRVCQSASPAELLRVGDLLTAIRRAADQLQLLLRRWQDVARCATPIADQQADSAAIVTDACELLAYECRSRRVTIVRHSAQPAAPVGANSGEFELLLMALGTIIDHCVDATEQPATLDLWTGGDEPGVFGQLTRSGQTAAVFQWWPQSAVECIDSRER